MASVEEDMQGLVRPMNTVFARVIILTDLVCKKTAGATLRMMIPKRPTRVSTRSVRVPVHDPGESTQTHKQQNGAIGPGGFETQTCFKNFVCQIDDHQQASEGSRSTGYIRELYKGRSHPGTKPDPKYSTNCSSDI